MPSDGLSQHQSRVPGHADLVFEPKVFRSKRGGRFLKRLEFLTESMVVLYESKGVTECTWIQLRTRNEAFVSSNATQVGLACRARNDYYTKTI